MYYKKKRNATQIAKQHCCRFFKVVMFFLASFGFYQLSVWGSVFQSAQLHVVCWMFCWAYRILQKTGLYRCLYGEHNRHLCLAVRQIIRFLQFIIDLDWLSNVQKRTFGFFSDFDHLTDLEPLTSCRKYFKHYKQNTKSFATTVCLQI